MQQAVAIARPSGTALLLSLAAASAVAPIGEAPGRYAFFGHLKWAPIIALSCGASILAHMWVNAGSLG